MARSLRLTGLALALLLAACGREDAAVAADAENGRLLLRQFGCGNCHRIPGVATASGEIGPPLEHVAQRVYLAGFVPNTPDNMVRWIRDPQSHDPATVMPNLGVSEAHARDMTAYLFTLR